MADAPAVPAADAPPADGAAEAMPEDAAMELAMNVADAVATAMDATGFDPGAVSAAKLVCTMADGSEQSIDIAVGGEAEPPNEPADQAAAA